MLALTNAVLRSWVQERERKPGSKATGPEKRGVLITRCTRSALGDSGVPASIIDTPGKRLISSKGHRTEGQSPLVPASLIGYHSAPLVAPLLPEEVHSVGMWNDMDLPAEGPPKVRPLPTWEAKPCLGSRTGDGRSSGRRYVGSWLLTRPFHSQQVRMLSESQNHGYWK